MPARLRPQTRRDDGAAMVEFAFVGVLLVVLLFGIINMGVLLSFKQNLTQAASESARAVVGVDDDDSTASDERYDVVDAALRNTLGDHDRTCNPAETRGSSVQLGGMRCLRMVHVCGTTKVDYDALAADPSGGCLTVRIEYDNTGPDRLMPAFPIIAAMEPDTMSAQTTIRLAPVT